MHIEHLYGGSALETVDRSGRVRLPNFVREVTQRRSDAALLVVAPHESDPCLTGYDPHFRRMLFADSERLRLRDEATGGDAGAHHAHARRAFGLAEEAAIDAAGRIALPRMVRRLARIEDFALFVGTGGAFEIWNPHLAAASGDPALVELARWRLGDHMPATEKEE